MTYTKLCSLNMLDSEPILTLDYLHTTKTGVCAGASGVICAWKYTPSAQQVDQTCQITQANSQNDSLSQSKHLASCEGTQLSCKIDTPCKGFNAVKLRPDCKLLVACSWDGMVRLHGPKRGKLLALSQFHHESVTSVTFDDDYKFVTASRDRMLCCWDLYSNNKWPTCQRMQCNKLNEIHFGSSNLYLIIFQDVIIWTEFLFSQYSQWSFKKTFDVG